MKKLIITLVAILVCLISVAGFCIYLEFFQDDSGKGQQELSVPGVTLSSEPSGAIESSTPTNTLPTDSSDVTVDSSATEETTEETYETTSAPETTTQNNNNDNDDDDNSTTVLPDVDIVSIDGDVTNSGSFSSYTGTNLDVVVEWKTFTDSDGDLRVRLNVSLNCYNLYVGYRYSGITINLGGTTKYLDTEEISYTGGGTNILIGSCIMDMPSDSANVSVSWAYKGSYNQVKMDYITAEGTIAG